MHAQLAKKINLGVALSVALVATWMAEALKQHS